VRTPERRTKSRDGTEPSTARSALELRAALALFGFVVSLVLGILVLTSSMEGLRAWGWFLLAVSVLALTNLVVVLRRRKRG
jgi:hypothetical protein